MDRKMSGRSSPLEDAAVSEVEIPVITVEPTRTTKKNMQYERTIDVVPCYRTKTPISEYTTNMVRTSRYTVWNFLPLNLYEQLSELQNFYFLCIGVLQAIKPISTSDGIPNMYIPLTFILFVSGLRAAIEDYHRHQSDRLEASRVYEILEPSSSSSSSYKFSQVTSADLVVGDFIRIHNNQPVPADILFLRSAHERGGHCFVETSSLDGETDLKPKVAISIVHESFRKVDDLKDLVGILQYEGPNKRLETFRGVYTPTLAADDRVMLTAENLLLRGTVLKNTEYIWGIVVYTGDDSKIRRNVKQEKRKLPKSKIMKVVDRGIIGMLILQLVLCIIGGMIAGIFHDSHKDDFYLQLSGNGAAEGSVRFFTWFIILSQLVPISLLVSSEIVKTFQSFFINRDVHIYDVATNTPALVRNSVINEDLGEVEFIFSDKTGTLTQNRMEFRVALIGALPFGSSETEISRRVTDRMEEAKRAREGIFEAPTRDNWTDLVAQLKPPPASPIAAANMVNFDKTEEYLDMMYLGTMMKKSAANEGLIVDYDSKPLSQLMADMRMFLVHMAISNTITPIYDDKTQDWVYQSSSPDELALALYAKHMGYTLVGRNPTKLHINGMGRVPDTDETFKHLATLSFNSKRKRVTVIYEQNGNVMVMAKGADSSLLPLTAPSNEDDALRHNLICMAKNGLRTLVVCHSNKTVKWWKSWLKLYEKVSALPESGDERGHQKGGCSEKCRICHAFLRIEEAAELKLLGATAIEDRLQDLVPESIADYLQANIKVWMLTGDKKETAKNIAMACNLIDPDMEDTLDWRKSRLIEITGAWAKFTSNHEELLHLFRTFDTNHDNHIDRNELEYFFKELGMPLMEGDRSEVDVLFTHADSNNDGIIDFDEFCNLMASINLSMTEAVEADIRQGIRLYQTNGKNKAVSMVVEGAAFGCLYPFSNEENKTKKKKKKKDKRKGKIGANIVRTQSSYSVNDIERLRNDFYELAGKMKSVVCCRMTPFQKAKIVEEIKRRNGVTTLAIGDGANDEAMILTADVGVGISGLEGTAASRAAAFAIGQFRFLHTLLFVHGHWSNRRTAKLVVYIFYKAIMVVLVMFWFGCFSGFSGQQYFSDWIYLYYNVLFTAAPIIVLAVLDQVLQRDTLENNPIAYQSIQQGIYFSPNIFYTWVGRSFWHSIILYFTVHLSLGIQDVAHEDGKVHGIWLTSTTTYSCVVLLATLRIILEFSTITWIHHLFLWLSLFGYFLVIWIITLPISWAPDTFGVIERMYATWKVWLVMLLTISLPLLIDTIVYGIFREWKPTAVEILQEQQKLDESEIHAQRTVTIKQPLKNPLHIDTSAGNISMLGEKPSSPSSHVPVLGSKDKVEVLLHHMLRRLNATSTDLIENGSTSQFIVHDTLSPKEEETKKKKKKKDSHSSDESPRKKVNLQWVKKKD